MVIIYLFAFQAYPSFAAEVTLDPTYNNDGKIITSFNSDAYVNKIILQLDGKEIAVGSNSIGGHRNWSVGRYNLNGTQDVSFGDNGTITQDFGYDQVLHDVVMQSDGKIIVAGSDASGNGLRIWTIGRYNSIWK